MLQLVQLVQPAQQVQGQRELLALQVLPELGLPLVH
jgi:hypothetical protein